MAIARFNVVVALPAGTLQNVSVAAWLLAALNNLLSPIVKCPVEYGLAVGMTQRWYGDCLR